METKTVWHRDATRKQAEKWLARKPASPKEGTVCAASKDLFAGYTAYIAQKEQETQPQTPINTSLWIQGI